MFVEEAQWLGRELARLALPPDARVINVASSTEHYRTVEQPHVEREVLAPLRERGALITHLDIKEDPGVDLVLDLNAPGLDLRSEIGGFDMVLATGLIEHLDQEQAERICSQLVQVAEPGGYIVVSTPESYRRTMDPVDPGLRPTPADLMRLLQGGGEVEEVAAESVRIDDSRYYKGFASRASVVPIGGRWLPLPGASEQVRRVVSRWRWREACLIARRAG